jgi:hypothetical protein
MARKSWLEKLRDPTPHEVKPAPMDIAGMKAGQIMLVPTAAMIDNFMRSLPAGASMDVRTMREALARQHHAEVTCPIYTGFHLRTVAEAAYEAYEQGAPIAEITPFWRIIDSKTPTAQRLACGLEFIRMRRRQEGLKP